MSEEDLDYERTLLQIPSVFVFKIPPRTAAEGHRASAWPQEPICNSKLKIVSKAGLAVIYLYAPDGKLFAVCPVRDDACVEKTVDSGRYFALKIENSQGRHAFIGIAFQERNEAFDFNVALSEHNNQKLRENQAREKMEELSRHHSTDLSLKQGEKISIKVPHAAHRNDKSSGGFGGLAPPPSYPNTVFGSPTPANNTSSSVNAGFTTSASKVSAVPGAHTSDPFAAPFTSSSDPFSSPSRPAVTSSSTTDPFANFGSDPFSASTPVRGTDPFASSSFSPSADPFSGFASPLSSSSTSAASPAVNKPHTTILKPPTPAKPENLLDF